MSKTSKMGRPVKPFNLPKDESRMTVNTLVGLNPHIKCRLSIYTKVGKLVKHKVLMRTISTEPSSGENHVGKPLEVLSWGSGYRSNREARIAALASKVAKLPAIALV